MQLSQEYAGFLHACAMYKVAAPVIDIAQGDQGPRSIRVTAIPERQFQNGNEVPNLQNLDRVLGGIAQIANNPDYKNSGFWGGDYWDNTAELKKSYRQSQDVMRQLAPLLKRRNLPLSMITELQRRYTEAEKLHNRVSQMQEQMNDDSWVHNKIRQVGRVWDRTFNPKPERKPAITDKPYTINPEKQDRAIGAANAVLNDPRAGDSGFWGGNYSKRRDALLAQRASAQKIKDQLEPVMNDATAKYKLSEADRIAYQKRLDAADDVIDRSNKTISVLDNDSPFSNGLRQTGEFFSNVGSSISNGWNRMFSSDKHESQF